MLKGAMDSYELLDEEKYMMVETLRVDGLVEWALEWVRVNGKVLEEGAEFELSDGHNTLLIQMRFPSQKSRVWGSCR
jgi:hypothetical protein